MTKKDCTRDFIKKLMLDSDNDFWTSSCFENKQKKKGFSDNLYDVISNMPQKKIFRFRTCSDNSFSGFINNEIFLSKASEFNDPYDSVPYVDIKEIGSVINSFFLSDNIKKILTGEENRNHLSTIYTDTVFVEFIKNIKNRPEIINEIISDSCMIDHENIILEIENYFSQNIYVSCFSERVDNMLMWSHYANSHKGFALEYQTDAHPLFKCSEVKCCDQKENCRDFFRFAPVVYDKLRYNATYTYEFIAVKLYLYRKINPTGAFNDSSFDIESIFKYTLAKLNVWEYEKEWRMFHICRKGNSQRKCGLILNPTAIYYGEKICKDHKIALSVIAKSKGIKEYDTRHRLDYNDDRIEIIPIL